MSGRACRTRVIVGARSSIKSALNCNLPEDLRAALCELRRRVGESGPVQDDVLGWAPDSWEEDPLEIRTGEYDSANYNLRRSIEILESQPWLPASARSITESVLQAIGRRPVGALVDSLPETDALAWESICGWARPQRRDCAGMLRMARRAWELLTGSWPWGSSWVGTQRPAPRWVGDLLGREKRVVLDYAPLTKCTCPACVSRREERENARNKFYLAELRREVSDVCSALRALTERVARIEGTLSGPWRSPANSPPPTESPAATT